MVKNNKREISLSLKVLAWIGGIISAIVVAVFVLNAETTLGLKLKNVTGPGEYLFELQAYGSAPVKIGTTELLDGNVETVITRDVALTPQEFDELMHSDILKRGTISSSYSKDLTVFPNEKRELSLYFTPEKEFMTVSAMTFGFNYEILYDTPAIDKFMTIAEEIGLVKKKRNACFFACGGSGAEINCETRKLPIEQLRQHYCDAGFRNDQSCCSYIDN